MNRYVPSSAAEPLSAALYRLSRPAGGGVTTALFGFVSATDGSRWLVVDTTLDIPVHPQAELGAIADILRPWIAGGQLAADTNANLAALVESKRGQRLIVYDAFPELFKGMSKTRQQMIAAGLLAGPEVNP